MESRTKKQPSKDGQSQHSNTPPSDSMSDFTDSASSVSSRSGSRDASRANTPRQMPKFQYDKEELVKIRDRPLSKKRPKCLSPENDNPDGYWDPDIWIRSFDTNSRGSSPLTAPGQPRERKRPAELERETIFKRKSSVSSDPKGRILEEEEDGLGIVLSPQRRSFGTGCHVSMVPQRRPGSPNDSERDSQGTRDHRKGSKIGSGRIQINHERHEREYRDQRARYERDDHRPFDRPNPLDRFRRDDTRDRRDDRRDDRDRRDERRDDRREDRDRRDDRRDSRERREEGMMRERFRRDFGGDRDRYDNGRMRRDLRRHEEEPEWFTEGPSSQSETIELHGFEGPSSSRETSEEPERASAKEQPKERGKHEQHPERERIKTSKEKKTDEDKAEKEAKKMKIDKKLREDKGEKEEDQPRSRAGSMTVADRNGSVETNESSSSENSPHHAEERPPRVGSGGGSGPPPGIVTPGQPATGQDFDFNEFFKIDNIPGLTDAVHVEQEHASASGSRFSQWFQISSGSHPSSRNDSRRSSINEEFGYLNDLLNLSGGQKSPVIPSPPLIDPHARYGVPRVPDFKHFGVITSSGEQAQQQQHQQQQNLMEMLKKASATGIQGPRTEHPSQDLQGKERPPFPGQALAASEVEANLKALLMGNADSGVASVRVSAEPKVFSPPQGAMMPVSGKVTTVSELEAGLKQLGLNKDAQAAAAITAANKQLAMEYLLKQKKDQMQKNDISQAGDMAAFNKLLMMMKASGVLHDTPKMPRKKNGQPISPINIVTVLHQDILQPKSDVIQKLVQQQQQAKLLQQQQQQQQQQTKIQQQQQQQQVKQIQQQHQQKQVQDQIIKFMKQNPGLMPKSGANSSPISPSLNTLQPPASPRCPSPAIPQQALLQPQQSPSPRAPSPIMFGSQPPMHLTAPSPIHPTQMPQNSQTLSPNTLQVGQGNNVRRVPSPQELIVHTQAIMQNALIKKQLEDQKERFLKKQQGRAKSPNLLGNGTPVLVSTIATTAPNSTPVILAKPSPAFTPTSVIRKMVNDKAEKQQDGDSFDQASPEKKPPILKIIRMDSSDELSNVDEEKSITQPHQVPKVDTPPIMTVASDGSINIPVPVTPKTPNKSIVSDAGNGTPQTSSTVPTTPGKSPRALIGQGTMNTPGQMMGPTTPAQAGVSNSQQVVGLQQSGVGSGRPIVKGINQTSPGQQPSALTPHQAQRPIISGVTQGLSPQSQQQKIDLLSQSQQQRPIIGSQQLTGAPPQAQGSQQTPPQGAQGRPPPSPNMPRASGTQFPMAGRMPIVRAGSVGISPPTTTNPLLMQRMVQAGSVANAGRGFQQMGVNQLSPISALQAAQAQAQAAQAQQRNLDPRIQAGRNVYPMGTSGSLIGANTSPRGGFQMSNLNRALSPQSQMGPVSLGKPDGMNVSPSLMSHQAMNTNLGALFGAHGGVEGNLAKWFGNDVLKHQGPAMPPLPSQGQKVMTVDEIERRQQMVTN